ncbi:MAG: glycine betaine ABC transporter substrate-binding protein, partial [Kiloniellales bacterium]
MTRTISRRAVLAGAAALVLAASAHAADPAACKKIHLSDVGWSCITATTALASQIFEALGYEPKATVLSVPVTFESLKTGDLDAFLGLWLPSQESMIR